MKSSSRICVQPKIINTYVLICLKVNHLEEVIINISVLHAHLSTDCMLINHQNITFEAGQVLQTKA